MTGREGNLPSDSMASLPRPGSLGREWYHAKKMQARDGTRAYALTLNDLTISWREPLTLDDINDFERMTAFWIQTLRRRGERIARDPEPGTEPKPDTHKPCEVTHKLKNPGAP